MFDRIYCINLDRRPDKWEAFRGRCPASLLSSVLRFSAIDYAQCPPPVWWKAGGGAWGCYRSHHAIIECCLQEGVASVLILEDDAAPAEDFERRLAEYFESLPADWRMAYLGGQLLHTQREAPRRVNQHVYRPYNVNRTHAYALRGEGLKTVYRHLSDSESWKQRHHIDHHLGVYHEGWPEGVYCPAQWLFGQAGGMSDVNGRLKPTEFWTAPAMDAGEAVTVAPTVEGETLPEGLAPVLARAQRLDVGVLRARILRWVKAEQKAGRAGALPDHPQVRRAFPGAEVA